MIVALYPAAERAVAAKNIERRLDALAMRIEHGSAGPFSMGVSLSRLERLGPLLASWETVGGCGAGASTGTGGGLKWIGRNVVGGLFHAEAQANYISTTYGYNYVTTAFVSRDLGEKWNVGVVVPFLYKFMRDPYDIGVDVQNKGLGDVNLLVTRRLGAINDWSLTLSLGAPTGTHDAQFRNEVLPQDRQLGLGKATASLIVDHTIDKSWGPTVIGGTANWRGGQNELGSYRAPTATLYGYSGYILGPIVPALGASVTGAARHDRDREMEQATPVVTLAGTLSLEWSSQWIAVLIGGSVPYGYTQGVDGIGAGWSTGPWVVALGVALAPF